jgi:hypothetical protein
MNVFVNTVVNFSEEKSISANAHGKQNISFAVGPVLASLLTEAPVNTAVSFGITVVSVTFISWGTGRI